MKKLGLSLLAIILLAACGPSPTKPPTEPATTAPPATTSPQPVQTAVAPTEELASTQEFPGGSLPTERAELFVGSGLCAACHSNMTDSSGHDVSITTDWRSAMMANAARDPYWQASVKRESLRFPEFDEIIQDKCATCHMPKAWYGASAAGESTLVFQDGFVNPDHPAHKLAMDGVACTLCHQIEPDNLAAESSFSGQYRIDEEAELGQRAAFGPFSVTPDQAEVMTVSSGFQPVQSEHIKRSAVCATCHTLYTRTLDAGEEQVDLYPEQVPFLEWMASDYASTTSCQGCHMPRAEGGVILSVTGGEPRSPFSQHLFLGGNTYMLSIFEQFGPEMNVTASSEQFRTKRLNSLEQLNQNTATLSLSEPTISDGYLEFDVEIQVLTGHKFPTAFPSRRAWLHVEIMDTNGDLIFESGAFEANGLIQSNANDLDPSQFEPHYDLIEEPDQVQIYEPILGDINDEVTTHLLRAATYIKDNRLLPTGLTKAEAEGTDFQVYGRAVQDESFQAAGDVVTYRFPVETDDLAYQVQVELLYQSIGYRWAENMRADEAEESRRFLGYYDQMPNTPVVIAQAERTAGD